MSSNDWTPIHTNRPAPHQTQVTVRRTEIKMVNEANDMVYTVNVYGKLNVIDSKKYAKKVDCTYVSKEDIKEVFWVDTHELMSIKQDKNDYTI